MSDSGATRGDSSLADITPGMRRVLRFVRWFALGALFFLVHDLLVARGADGFAPVVLWTALLSAGFMIGAIFAVPKSADAGGTQQASGAAATGPTASPAAGATHLGAAADVVTKSLVGLTLVGWNGTVFPLLERCATEIAASYGREAGVPVSVGWAAVCYFVILGWMLGYLPVRLYLNTLFDQADRIREATQRAYRAGLGTARQNLSSASSAEAVKVPSDQSVSIDRLDEVRNRAAQVLEKLADLSNRVEADPWNSDPNRGRYGGSPTAKGWTLDGLVEPLVGPEDPLSKVQLRVRAPQGFADRLAHVRLVLHPTFADRHRDVPFDEAGVAQASIVSYGAFTVGAVAPDGTRLELDLQNAPGATDAFRNN